MKKKVKLDLNLKKITMMPDMLNLTNQKKNTYQKKLQTP